MEEKEQDKKDKIGKIVAVAVPIVLMIIIVLAVLIVRKPAGEDSSISSGEQLQLNIKEYSDDSILSQEEPPVMAETERKDSEPSPAVSASPGQKKEAEEYSKVVFDWEMQLGEMKAYWDDNNQKALDDLAGLERFRAMSWTLRDTTDYYYYGSLDHQGRPNGEGIAVYAGNRYYCGDWSAGKREGQGTYLHYHLSSQSDDNEIYRYHFYYGQWHNDLPDGEGAEHYEFVTDRLKEGIGYNQNLIGEYKEGLCNGEFYLTNVYYDEEVREWYADAVMGSWEYRNENKDQAGRRPVQVETVDPDNYIWLLPKDNKSIGVPCLTQSGKIRED